MTTVTHHTLTIEDPHTSAPLKLFYREAGPQEAPVVLLLHGFPSSSHQYRALMPRLADKYRVVAPDFPGFGFSDAPPATTFDYTFDHLAEVMNAFVAAIGLTRFALYLFDYGAPVGFRLAASHPERVLALISQNGNAYEEGLSEGWAPMRAYWADPTPVRRDALRPFLTHETTLFQYTHGAHDTTRIAPETYTLDQHLLDRAGNADIQLDLLRDYANNVAAYPRFHDYFRTHRPPTLAVWGHNDPFFLPAGAHAFVRDNPRAEVHFVDGGHFPLETRLDEIVAIVRPFLARTLDTTQGPSLFGPLSEAGAPLAAHPALSAMRSVFGFVPNLGLVLATEPAVLGAYLQMLHALSDTCLDPIAQQVAMNAASRANGAEYGIAVHTALAAQLGAEDDVVQALRDGGPLADQKLDAVRVFATSLASHRTQVSDAQVRALLAAGYPPRATIAIALAVAAKTLVNAAAHLARPSIDTGFLVDASALAMQ